MPEEENLQKEIENAAYNGAKQALSEEEKEDFPTQMDVRVTNLPEEKEIDFSEITSTLKGILDLLQKKEGMDTSKMESRLELILTALNKEADDNNIDYTDILTAIKEALPSSLDLDEYFERLDERLSGLDISKAIKEGLKGFHSSGWLPVVDAIDTATGKPSVSNNSTTALAGGATFTGTAETNKAPDVMVSCFSDTAGTLYFDFSVDGTSWRTFPPAGFAVSAGVHEFHTAVKGPRYFRVRFVNGSSAQSTFQLYTYFGTFRQPNLPFNTKISQDADAIAIRSDTEEEVLKGRVAGEYIVSKFGQNPDVDTAEDIWDGGGTYTGFSSATPENFEVLSSGANAANDTNSSGSGARVVRCFYLDDNDNMFDSSGNPLYFDVNMNGTTGVDSGVSGTFVWRSEVISSGSTGSNEGTIIVRWITTTSVVFQQIQVGVGQTRNTAFKIPAGYSGYLRRYNAEMIDNQTNRSNGVIKTIKNGTNTTRLVRPYVLTNDKGSSRNYYGGPKFEAQEAFIFRALDVTSTNAIINVDYGLLLVRN